MRVGVFEWATCGGATGIDDVPESIRQEGRAMCEALCNSLRCAGHQPVRCLHADDEGLSLYATCDTTIVIAPESDNILKHWLQLFRNRGWPVCNCDDLFIQATSDKWMTAALLAEHELPHPPTYLLEQVDHLTITDSNHPLWVVKPRDGAGCDGVERFERHQFKQVCQARATDPQRWIVQPWLGGRALSRSTIVDIHGACHWLPVATQNLELGRTVKYLGGSLATEFTDSDQLQSLLTRAIKAMPGKALGWVGFDFIWNSSNSAEPLTIIEINPRLTTSFVSLCVTDPQLAGKIV